MRSCRIFKIESPLLAFTIDFPFEHALVQILPWMPRFLKMYVNVYVFIKCCSILIHALQLVHLFPSITFSKFHTLGQRLSLSYFFSVLNFLLSTFLPKLISTRFLTYSKTCIFYFFLPLYTPHHDSRTQMLIVRSSWYIVL